MSWTVLVDPKTLEIQGQFLTTGASGVNWPGVQCTCEDPTVVMATRDDSGEIVLLEDPAKLEDHKATLWSQLRTERNRRLAASDWTQLPDARVDKDAWVEYRQKLRDLPGETQDPLVIEWPQVPQ
jgi:hypothetical protein